MFVHKFAKNEKAPEGGFGYEELPASVHGSALAMPERLPGLDGFLRLRNSLG